jgi:hypothetical protein
MRRDKVAVFGGRADLYGRQTTSQTETPVLFMEGTGKFRTKKGSYFLFL